MTDEPGDKIVDLAFERAQKHKKKSPADKPVPRRGGGGGPPTREAPPVRLPPNSPVTALGVNDRTYFFLNARGQFAALPDKDIGRNAIIGLFGGDDYLRGHWPKFDKSGQFVTNFDHGAMSPVLIASCHDKGIWTPEDNVRGVGTWAEDDGTLVMHSGDMLFLSDGMKVATGLRGRMLYPAASPQPHPIKAVAGIGGPAEVLLVKLRSWNWARGELDAKLHLGWIGAAILGAAPDWRPIEWITGGSGTGKSTLMKLTRWVFGARAMITSEDATPAGIKHRTKNSALPVSIDELESEGKNERARDITKLARISSSGGESLRGSPSGDAMAFTARNAFQFSSIVIPSLPQQDKNRMAILALEPVEWEGAHKKTREPGEDWDADEEEVADEEDTILGRRTEWGRVGQGLRGRILAEWPRYKKTFRAYRKALEKAGHNARGCDQFGALGAAYDLLLFDCDPQQLNELAARATEWADELPAASLPETSGYSSSHQACLAHLLGAQLDAFRGGNKVSVSKLLRLARDERQNLQQSNSQDSVQVLEQQGIKIYRDKRDPEGKAWWVAISHTHPGLARIFNGTDWGGLPGAPGAWAQMMGRMPGAVAKTENKSPLRLRFDGHPDYCTALPWETVLPPAVNGDGESEMVSEKDQ
jgi:hypothetical protein